jgi:1-acyl-sn-glycerol-3-phosphate acyltransferase
MGAPRTPPGDPHPDRVERDFWWSLGLVTLGRLFRLFFRVRFIGRENIPAAGPAILASNHVSVLDPIAIALGPSRRGRTVRFLAAEEAFRVPFVGWGLRRIRQIPIRRGARDVRALDSVASVIRRGALAGIFPEGRVSEDGRLQRGRRGVARIALAAEVPVIPVAVWGAQVRWPRRGLRLQRPWRPRMAVVFGRPVTAVGDPFDAATVTELTDRIMMEIAHLLPIAQANGDGPGLPAGDSS